MVERAGRMFGLGKRCGCRRTTERPCQGERAVNKTIFLTLASLLPVAAGARTVESATSPPQACLSPTSGIALAMPMMAALLPASREQAEDWCEDGDARALERVRAVLRLLGRRLDRGEPAPDAAKN